MTEKLFYQDPHLFEFTAAVTDCRPEKGGFSVVLDRTAFYPEGGGQPTDLGELIPEGAAAEAVPVTFVKETDGEIRHMVPSPIPAGKARGCLRNETRVCHHPVFSRDGSRVLFNAFNGDLSELVEVEVPGRK